MSHAASHPVPPNFEIDHPNEYARYFLRTPREIAFYLSLMAERKVMVSVYLDDGESFFLSTLAPIEESGDLLAIDPPRDDAMRAQALAAGRTTLVTALDRIKIQIRLGRLAYQQLGGRPYLTAPSPDALLRLQRRDYFRLEPPATHPIQCTVALERTPGERLAHNLKVADISGGGISLYAPTTLADACMPGTELSNCRLEIPDEGVLSVTLRIRKTVELSTQSGAHQLRIGCEFVDLTSARQAIIERYITRIERERKARASGLAD